MFNYLAPKTLARCEDGRGVYLTKLWDVFWVSQNIQKVTVARHKLVFEHIHLYGIHIHIIYIPIGFTLDGLVVNHLPNLFWGITASQVKEFHDKAVPRFSYVFPTSLVFCGSSWLKCWRTVAAPQQKLQSQIARYLGLNWMVMCFDCKDKWMAINPFPLLLNVPQILETTPGVYCFGAGGQY